MLPSHQATFLPEEEESDMLYTVEAQPFSQNSPGCVGSWPRHTRKATML